MGADVEREIARAEELPVQPAEAALVPGPAMVDQERAREAPGPGEIARPPSFGIDHRH
jgi:hypothetical protein